MYKPGGTIRDAIRRVELRSIATFDFHSDVTEAVYTGQAFLVGGGRLRTIGDDRNDRSMVARAYLPKVKVCHLVPLCFQASPDRFLYDLIRAHVEEHRPGLLDEAERPTADDETPDDPDDWVCPKPT